MCIWLRRNGFAAAETHMKHVCLVSGFQNKIQAESKTQNSYVDDVDECEYLSEVSDFKDNLNDNIPDDPNTPG